MSTHRADAARGGDLALRRRRWEPPVLVALALGSAGLGAALTARLASGEDAGDRPVAARRERGAEPPASAAEAARDVDTLARALEAPHRRAAPAIGPHRVRDHSALRMTTGDGSESLAVDVDLAMARSGELRARSESSAGYRRDIVFADGRLYSRTGGHPFHRRPPAHPDEARELADELTSAPGEYLAPLLTGAVIARRRDTEHGGRQALAVELATGDAGARIDAGAWRADRAEVTRVRGELVLDAATGALLSADAGGDVVLSRGARRLALEIEVARELETAPAPLRIEPPDGDEVVALRDSLPDRGARPDEMEELRWNEP